MNDIIKICPFCGGIPKVNGNTITHVTKGDHICIIDDTQYDLEKWNSRNTEWISVEKELPEKHITVLVFSENQIKFNHLVISEPHKIIWAGYMSVTHWMLLPEPPK